MITKNVKEQVGKKTKKQVRKKAPITQSSFGFSSTDGALFVGIDLGTSRASIAASNGVREVVPTYVGYPKDRIGAQTSALGRADPPIGSWGNTRRR